MKASEVIKELQKRIELYGDWEVVIRIDDYDDIDLGLVYADDESEIIVVNSFY